VIGDSVTLGAKYYGNLSNRIAKVKNVSWCRTDALGSRGLTKGAKPTGVQLANSLKKKGKLGKIVVYALATNHSYSYKEVKEACDKVGKDRYVILVTGYVKGHSYTLKSRKAALKLAKKKTNVVVADWYSVMKAKKGKGLSDNYCHLTHKSAIWYGDVIIKAVREITAMTTTKKADKLSKLANKATIDTFGTITMAEGSSAKSPAGFYGGYPKDSSLTWTSSDTGVVKVSAKGRLSAVSEGSAGITVSSSLNAAKKATFKVKVTKKKTLSGDITLSGKKLSKKALKIKITPKNKGVTGVPAFKSANNKIATVTRSGVVTGKKAGKVKITVDYGGSKKTLTVKVKK
jgi:hypothetical protein